jgi:hypothetical protein
MKRVILYAVLAVVHCHCFGMEEERESIIKTQKRPLPSLKQITLEKTSDLIAQINIFSQEGFDSLKEVIDNLPEDLLIALRDEILSKNITILDFINPELKQLKINGVADGFSVNDQYFILVQEAETANYAFVDKPILVERNNMKIHSIPVLNDDQKDIYTLTSWYPARNDTVFLLFAMNESVNFNNQNDNEEDEEDDLEDIEVFKKNPILVEYNIKTQTSSQAFILEEDKHYLSLELLNPDVCVGFSRDPENEELMLIEAWNIKDKTIISQQRVNISYNITSIRLNDDTLFLADIKRATDYYVWNIRKDTMATIQNRDNIIPSKIVVLHENMVLVARENKILYIDTQRNRIEQRLELPNRFTLQGVFNNSDLIISNDQFIALYNVEKSMRSIMPLRVPDEVIPLSKYALLAIKSTMDDVTLIQWKPYDLLITTIILSVSNLGKEEMSLQQIIQVSELIKKMFLHNQQELTQQEKENQKFTRQRLRLIAANQLSRIVDRYAKDRVQLPLEEVKSIKQLCLELYSEIDIIQSENMKQRYAADRDLILEYLDNQTRILEEASH